MAVVTTLLPFTGLTLPFISYGSSSLIMCMVAAGILLSISRHQVERPRDQIEQAPRLLRRPPIALRARLAEWWRPSLRSLGKQRRGTRGTIGTARRSPRRVR